MSYRYASSLFQTASRAATCCAFDYITAMGKAQVERLRELASMTDDELWMAIDQAEADGWRMSSDEDDEDVWSDSDIDLAQLRIAIVHLLPAEDVCYHCGDAIASVAGVTFCTRCVETSEAWDATDDELLERLGKVECAKWRDAAYQAGDTETVEAIDRTVGCCHCDTEAVERTCEDCGCTALVIDCGHHAQPASISADGQGRSLCDVCHSARVEAVEAARELDDALPRDGVSETVPWDGGRGLYARADGHGVLVCGTRGVCRLGEREISSASARKLAAYLEDMPARDERFSSSWVMETVLGEPDAAAAIDALTE